MDLCPTYPNFWLDEPISGADRLCGAAHAPQPPGLSVEDPKLPTSAEAEGRGGRWANTLQRQGHGTAASLGPSLSSCYWVSWVGSLRSWLRRQFGHRL